MKDLFTIIFGSLGVLGTIIICAVVVLVLYLLGVAAVFLLKWGTIITILCIGASCIAKNMDNPKKQ